MNVEPIGLRLLNAKRGSGSLFYETDRRIEVFAMDMNSTILEVRSWPLDDQIEFVHRMCDAIADDEAPLAEISDETKTELDRRMARHAANPDDVYSHEYVMKCLRRR